MLLGDLLKWTGIKDITSEMKNIDIGSIAIDSREVKPDTLFIALPGQKGHGIDYLDDVVRKGCRVIVAEDFRGKDANKDVFYVKTDDGKKFLREAVRGFYKEPSKKMEVIGVTGTNGKTTITYLLEEILRKANKKTAVIGTINYRYADKVFESKNTTPGLIPTQKLLYEIMRSGVSHCLMEVSSHALDQGRVDLIDFSSAIFTNLTGDHLDYHKNMEEYYKAKEKLFTGLAKSCSAIINNDDSYSSRLIKSTRANVLTYGIRNKSDVMAVDIKAHLEGSFFTLQTKTLKEKIETKLIGIHNIYNLLAAISYCLYRKVSPDIIKKAVKDFNGAPGRLERVALGQDFYIFIDYAHTEDALRNILKAVREVSDSKIILVFGCGGDRDKTKRPLMGRAACELADFSIVTSDNPRSEDPQTIIDEILKGFHKDNHLEIVNRKEAIKKALSLAGKNDVVILAGKGHENYQIFKDKTIEFDERDVLRKLLNV
ncbi:MAG: UDP-N-acetylmuramoyl-L-alanyl-D-glutamate--2,6-diaminopimelate ligase [Candidatus Omnitrophica bacterium]|nr:UDP-N-acetylmuramoyl-L-alanyl-D-glutamate--2,6-diaminopimelate ligase [Candidatus Omnitrophota bacterium]